MIFLDCDDVMLDWFTPFSEFVEIKTGKSTPNCVTKTYQEWFDEVNRTSNISTDKLVNEFNSSIIFTNLLAIPEFLTSYSPFQFEEDIVVISSCGKENQSAREQNILKEYGDIFTEIICLDYGTNKANIIKDLRNKYKFDDFVFVDDLEKNIVQVNSMFPKESENFLFRKHPFKIDFLKLYDVNNLTIVRPWKTEKLSLHYIYPYYV